MCRRRDIPGVRIVSATWRARTKGRGVIVWNVGSTLREEEGEVASS